MRIGAIEGSKEDLHASKAVGATDLGWMNHGSDLGWRILILWTPLQKEFPLWTFPSAVAENENIILCIETT